LQNKNLLLVKLIIMKQTILILFLCIVVFSCKNKASSTSETGTGTTTNNASIAESVKKVYDKILGSFVGNFGDNKITILITKAEGDSISGRSVVGGNDRPFAGLVSLKDGKYSITASEPGDDNHDGTFNFSIADANTNLIEGNWAPYKASVTPKKEYVLQRKEFKYDINVGEYKIASQRLLKESDVENLVKSDLEFMRNEIFARHGYCFKKKHLRENFENEEWYVPNTTNVADQLTAIEKKNIELIKRYEKYAEEFGDEFGR
jgi:hypothetical protein